MLFCTPGLKLCHPLSAGGGEWDGEEKSGWSLLPALERKDPNG